MQARSRSAVVTIMFVLVASIGAQQNITPATCAYPGGFTSCYQQALSVASTCTAEANSDAQRAVCACELDLNEIKCAVESCWNVVYGCEYQSLAFAWDGYCGGTLGDIPFFPAPENAPGGCSCNSGHILGNFTNVNNFYSSCLRSGSDVLACGCCQQSGDITSIYSLCPNDDPSYLGLSGIEKVLQAADSNPSLCAPYFDRYDCVKDLGFPSIGNSPYLRALPSTTGTLKPTTTGGSITAPLYGSAYVFTAGGSLTTIVPSRSAAASISGMSGSPPQSSSSVTASSSAMILTSGGYNLLSLLVLVVYTATHLA